MVAEVWKGRRFQSSPETRLATQITSRSYRSQAQMNRVLVKGRAPPHLSAACERRTTLPLSHVLLCRVFDCCCCVLQLFRNGHALSGPSSSETNVKESWWGERRRSGSASKSEQAGTNRHPALKEAQTKQLDILPVHCSCCCCSMGQQRSALELGLSEAHAAAVEEPCRQTAGV